MERKQFTFYRSYFEAVSNLPKTAQTAVLLAICDYALNEKAPKLSGTSKAVFELIRPTLDHSRKKAENRIKADEDKKKTETNEEQNDNKPITNEEQIGNEEEKELESELEYEKELEYEIECECECEKELIYQEDRPTAPALEEVMEYALAEGIPDSCARRFFLTYSSTGWLIKDKPMVDWKSRLLLWADEDKAKQNASAKPKPSADMLACMEKNMRRAVTGS